MAKSSGTHNHKQGGAALFGSGKTVGPAVARRIDEAQRLFGDGKPLEAAAIFGELGRAAEAAQMPLPAAQWHAQAARYYAAARNAPTALGHARAALSLFAAAEAQAHASKSFARLISELRAQGLNAEADTIQGEAQARLGISADDLQPIVPTSRGLPPKCPACGGAVRSDQVEWIDSHTAACSFCGSVIPAQ